jgi:glucose-6-phosphate 1-dehydrogenase
VSPAVLCAFASAGAPPSERADALVLFGASGDLARKWLFSALYDMAAAGRLDIPVIGIALSDVDDDESGPMHAGRSRPP